MKDRKTGFPTTQVKDAAAEHFTEVGAGTIHWQEILAAAEKNGVKHLFVERESGGPPAMERLPISYQNLQKAILIGRAKHRLPPPAPPRPDRPDGPRSTTRIP